MTNLKKYILASFLCFSLNALANEFEDCETGAIQVPAAGVLKTLKLVSEGLYKDIATLVVNRDGTGKLSILYENGEPKYLKLTYVNSKATFLKQISFDDLEKGKPLIFENAAKKGKAIVLTKGQGNFKNGNKYNFNLDVRSKLEPEQHVTYPIELEADPENAKLSSKNSSFSKIVISPGITLIPPAWDGTFKKVEFK